MMTVDTLIAPTPHAAHSSATVSSASKATCQMPMCEWHRERMAAAARRTCAAAWSGYALAVFNAGGRA